MTDIEWKISSKPVPYEKAIAFMEARVRELQEKSAAPCIWLLEHPPLYTLGTSAQERDIVSPLPFPRHRTGRGGQITYHGPGQRIAYAMLDLRALFAPEPPDLRRYIQRLERWVIATLAEFGVEGFTRQGRVGVWVNEKGVEKKIAAIGVRVRQWIAYHGIAINVHPDLSHYTPIVPCGIREFGVTSLHALGVNATMDEVDAALKRNAELFSGGMPGQGNRHGNSLR